MGINIETLVAAKKFTSETVLGGGAVVGKNVTISSITPIDGGNRITFSYTLDNGTTKTSTMDVMDGKDGIDGTNGKNGKDGQPGNDGADGIGISKIEKIGTVDLVDTYRITFTDNSTFDYEVKNGKDGQGGTGSGEENKIDSISVNGVNVVPDENKNVDITVPDAYDDTDIRAELANKADIDHTHTTVNGHTVESDVPVDAKFTDTVYDDTQVKTQIQAVANGLMDSVGYSADYKTIDIIAKNGVKKSVNVAPIISHASITELSDVDTTNKATGKALVYNATTSKHEYADVSGTDEKVKMDASTDAKYLGELLDNVTIANENGELKVKKLDGQEVTITEINYLKGLTMNVMDLVNMFSNGGVKIINTPVATYAELLTLDKSSFIEGISYLVYVLADENHDNAKTTYLVDKDSETPTYFGFADSQRDFTTNPIDLATEITGKLGIANMDSDAIKALFTVDDTYKTETATNNAFSTHGAKALYDELLLAIGNKANDSDLTAHKDDTDIHVSTEDRTKWDSAKTHADSAHAPSDAQENIIESVKVNNQEITPDENKAVNIDLTGYAEHDEIVGENLIPYPYKNTSKSINGVEFVDNGDGTVTATGTSTSDAFFYLSLPMTLKAGTYVFSNNGLVDSAKVHMQIYLYETPFTTIKSTISNVSPFTIESDCNVTIRLNVLSGETVDNYIFKPMLEAGSIVHEYQPYKLSRESLRTDIDNVGKLASRVDNQFATASGDYITVTDSVDGKLVELGVNGNSFQNSYTGKNILHNVLNPTYNYTGTDGSTITTTVDCDVITVTNTEKTGGGFYNHYAWIWASREENLIDISKYVGQKLTFSIDVISGSMTQRWLGFMVSSYKNTTDTSTSIKYLYNSPSSLPTAGLYNCGTLEVTQDFIDTNGKYIGVNYWISNNNIHTNFKFRTQIEVGDTATEYEPYVGGIPAPNPSYPQEIKSVGDDGGLVVKSRGKNLLNPINPTFVTITRDGITCTNNGDGTYTLNGTPTVNFLFDIVDRASYPKLKLENGKQYKLIGCPNGGSLTSYQIKARNLGGISYDTGNGYIFTKDPSVDDYLVTLRVEKGTVCNNLVFKPMLVDADLYPDVTYDDFEPYKGSSVTIPLSEPLRAIGDVKDEITYQDGKWGVLRRIGKYVIDGTENFILDSDHIADCGISVKIGNYTNILNGISVVSGNTRDMVTDYLGCRELDHIPYYDSSSTIDRGSGIYRTAGNVWLTFGAADIEKMGITKDLDSVKTWLSSHNITVHYPLGSPTFEPFADQTLPYLSTYDGVTNISNDDALSAEMTVKYPTTDASGVGSRNESRIAELEENKADKCAVADVGKTNIELIDSTNYTIGDNSGYTFYQVINGICYVDLLVTCVTPINGNTSAPGHLSLPKARSSFHATLIGANGTTDNIVQYVGASGVSFFKYGTAGKLYVGHFSYPVAES